MIQSKEKLLSYRKASEKFLNFKEKLGLDYYDVNCDEQDIISTLQVAFEGEIIYTQYCIEKEDFMLNFLNTNLEQKLTKYDRSMIIHTEILIMNKVDN